MNIFRQAAGISAVAITAVGMAQQSPNTWLFVGPDQLWPQTRSGRAIFAAHVPPTSLAMGSRGNIIFFRRNDEGESDVLPHKWTPPMYGESGFGTFGETGTHRVSYELFCCGITLMMDGKIATAGSNFGADHHPYRQLHITIPRPICGRNRRSRTG